MGEGGGNMGNFYFWLNFAVLKSNVYFLKNVFPLLLECFMPHFIIKYFYRSFF